MRCRTHADFLFFGLKQFIKPFVGPAAGGALVAIIPPVFWGYAQSRLIKLI